MSKLLIDTNVCIHNNEYLIKIEENTEKYISMTTVEELGKLQHDDLSVGYYARQQNKLIEFLINNNQLKLIQDDKTNINDYFEDPKLNDNIIINTARVNNMIVITDDTNMRIKCNLVNVESHPSIEKIDPSQILNPYLNISLTNEQLDILYKDGKIEKEFDFNGYQYLNLNDKKELLYHDQKYLYLLKQFNPSKKTSLVKQLKSKNYEQSFLLNALFDPTVKLITCIGQQGSGKTLLSLYGQIYQTIQDKYKKIYLIVNPVHVSNKDRLGFLPGGLDEKMLPYISQIYDNLNVLYNNDIPVEFADLFKSQLVEIIPIDFLRGRTIHDGFVIVDEQQNYNKHEIKTIITRMGDSSKIILLGDVEQIDTKLQIDQSGLFLTQYAFLNYNYQRHIRLFESERGELSNDQVKLL